MSTNFKHGVSGYGIPIIGGGGIPATKGPIYFVDYGDGSDGNKGTELGKAFKNYSYAYSRAASNEFAVICLIGNSTHVIEEMVTLSKNRIITIGVDGSPGRLYGQAAKVSMGVTTAATDIATIKNTGVRNIFQNIKFINNNTKDESLYCFADGGEYTQMINCELYKSTDLDETGAAELVCNGDSSSYTGCYIGSTVNATTGAIIRPNVLFSRGLANTGAVARDVYFESCILARKSGNTANSFMYGAEANCIERMAYVNNCVFWNAALAAAVPALNVNFGSALTDGAILLNNPVAMNAATAMGTQTGIFVNGAVPAADTTGIALQAT